MYIAEYEYIHSYYNIKVSGELPEEGILKGKAGELRFKRIPDGIAVYDSTLLTSGFISWPTAAEICVPQTINDIPVTELHQTVFPKSNDPIAIENGDLKRVFINIGERSTYDQVDIVFYGNADRSVELCSITFDGSLILHIPNSKTVIVNAQRTEIRGSIPNGVECLRFYGVVYPYIEYDWYGGEPNNHCFAGLKRLRIIDGKLCGESGWSFRDCASLEKIHLSGSVRKIPAYAFSNCRAFKDLYIPDTVREIGEYAFQGCTNLSSIHLPSGLNKIPKGAFKDCESLKKVFLADTIEAIEDQAFAGCGRLQKPWIPQNIKWISETAFPNPDWYQSPKEIKSALLEKDSPLALRPQPEPEQHQPEPQQPPPEPQAEAQPTAVICRCCRFINYASVPYCARCGLKLRRYPGYHISGDEFLFGDEGKMLIGTIDKAVRQQKPKKKWFNFS